MHQEEISGQLTCFSGGKPVWLFSEGHLPYDSKPLGNLLTLRKLDISHTGSYYCLGTTASKTLFWAQTKIKVFCKTIIYTTCIIMSIIKML